MFPLHTKTFPPDAATLRDALEESLRQVVTTSRGEVVTVEDASYPELRAIRVSVDGARASWRTPPPMSPLATTEPALRVEHFEISGRPITVERAALDVACTAREVQIDQGRDTQGNVVLVLQNAAEGRVEIEAAIADLESLLLSGAKAEAGKRGVEIEAVKLRLHAHDRRALSIQMEMRARKLLLATTVCFSGEVEIDDRLHARLSNLSCSANGALGSLACNLLGPHLERFNHREFSLLSLPLGEVQLRDIQIAAGDKLRVTANFGRAA